MKAFTYLYDTSSCKHPYDMRYLLEFLNKKGTLNIPITELESYYFNYCKEYWNCDFRPVIEQICDDFANYLSNQEVVD